MPFFKKSKKSLTNARDIGNQRSGFNIFNIGSKTPVWINTTNLFDLAKITATNPVAYSALSIRANFLSNGRVKIKDLKTGELIDKDTYIFNENYRNNQIVKRSFELFEKPNPLQSRFEFIKTYSFMKDTFGNAFIYGNTGLSKDVNINTLRAIWNVWPQYMNVFLTGKYFSATTINDIIEKWQFGYSGGSYDYNFLPQNIMHRKDPNVQLNSTEDIIFGRSRYIALKYPLSNIKAAYESENIILAERGARFVITPATNDALTGPQPMGTKDKEELEKQFEDYGLLNGQKQAIISEFPVNVKVIDQDIRKLGLFESIAYDTMIVANNFTIPEVLMKLYLQGATFENQNASVIRMYQGTTIPEFTDYVNDFNTWSNIEDFGFLYIPSFDHIPELQKNKKDEAIANSQISKQYYDKFLKGACTFNEWRQATGDRVEDWGNVRITELSDRELEIILGKYTPVLTTENI